MMLRYKRVVLELASSMSSSVTALFAESIYLSWMFETRTGFAIACLASGLVPELGRGRHMFYM